ncbi:MAG: hypothetical protein HY549_06935 [Elusimicrobia bacterium]|nr:hypothetical protein [Elusimicrobiota bacterium]
MLAGALALAACLAAPASVVLAAAEENQSCLGCHSETHPEALTRLAGSVHSTLACAACHAKASELPHDGARQVRCSACHQREADSLRRSPHGQRLLSQAGDESKSCALCHGLAHDLQAASSLQSPAARARQPSTCGHCHGPEGNGSAGPGKQPPASTFWTTVHGQLLASGQEAASCADCHGSHDIRSSGDKASRLSREKTANTCGRCHAGATKEFRNSVHGVASSKGRREAPTCTDCHGEHDIERASAPGARVSKATVAKTCGGCHGSERLAAKFGIPADRVSTFATSFHGLAAQGGDLRAANCASCHGWHDVLPSSDPRSRIHPSRLSSTCGGCHPGADRSLSESKIHAGLSLQGRGSRPARFFNLLYLFIVPITLVGMATHNLLDLLRKMLGARPGHPPSAIRLSLRERLEHAALLITFGLLAYSGFALEYPESWWTSPLRLIAGEAGRRLLHRAAALAFCALAVEHVVYLLRHRRGRRALLLLSPRLEDAKTAWAMLRFNLGAGKARPRLRRFSYIEKAEYWALVWGSGVMILTGALLLRNPARMPLWLQETARVVHSWEALLACAAIIVWHGYWVVFDPEIYPMNWSWLSGRPARSGRKEHE